MADTLALGASAARRVSSTLTGATKRKREMIEELRQCKICKKFFWDKKRFYSSRRASTPYYRSECHLCYNVKMRDSRIKSRIKKRIERELPKAKLRAAVRLLEIHPEVIAHLIAKNPVRYEQFLEEEKLKIVDELKIRSLKFGYRAGERNVAKIISSYEKAVVSLGLDKRKSIESISGKERAS